MKCFLRSQRVLPLATGILLVALVAVPLVNWALGRSAPHALADGTTWTPVSGLPANTSLSGVACSNGGGLLCVAVGDSLTPNNDYQGVIFTTTNGTTWTPVSGLPANIVLTGIACPNGGGLLCVAVGFTNSNGPAVILTTTNGTTWTPVSGLPATTSLEGIACSNGGGLLCVAVGDSPAPNMGYHTVILTTTDGATWTPVSGLPDNIVLNQGAVACSNGGGLLCVAVGASVPGIHTVILTTTNGTTWTPVSGLPATTFSEGGIACPNGGGLLCVAVGTGNDSGNGPAEIFTTTDGTTWTPVSSPPANTGLHGVACPNGGGLLCVAVGYTTTTSGQPEIFTTTDGTTWTPISGLPANTILSGVACPNGGGLLCVAVGYTRVTSSDQPVILFSSTATSADTTPPVLTVPGTKTLDATSPQGAVESYTVTATDPDNPSSQLTITCSPASGSTFPIGTTTVNCHASDPAGNSSTGSFQVVVQGAATQISNLISRVNSFNLSPQDIQTSFDSQLQAVQADLAANNTAQAYSDLTSFINHVNAQSGKHLTTDQANQLLAAATNIRNVLGC